MLALSKLFLIYFIALTPAFSLASDQGLFYSLHQATNLLEQISNKKCGTDLKLANEFLIQADKELGKLIMEKEKSKLEPLLHELWSFYKRREKINTFLLESYRLNLHTKAQKMKLKHNEHWHIAMRNCGKGQQAYF